MQNNLVIVRKVTSSKDELISVLSMWNQTWTERSSPAKNSSSTQVPLERSLTTKHKSVDLPTYLDSAPKSLQLSTSKPLISSNARHPKPHTNAPIIRRETSPAHMAKKIPGRFTPGSAISRHTNISDFSDCLTDQSDDEFDDDDWSSKISSPRTLMPREILLLGYVSSLKVCLRTEIYSAHLADPPPSSPAEAYSRILLIDVLDCPNLHHDSKRVQWFVPARGRREIDTRLYYPVQLSLYTTTGVVEIEDEFSYLGHGRFWCGGFIVVFSSRRVANGNLRLINATLKEECVWLEYIEADVFQIERWIRVSRDHRGLE